MEVRRVLFPLLLRAGRRGGGGSASPLTPPPARIARPRSRRRTPLGPPPPPTPDQAPGRRGRSTMRALGPAPDYHHASLGVVWKGRPVLAAVTRTLIAAVPVVLAVGLGLAAVHWLPPRRLGVNPWAWLLVEICCATAVLVLATRLARRFLPLTTLFRL